MTSAIARGARLSRDTLNAFLSSKSASTIEGSKIYPENNAALTQHLHSLGLDPNVRVRALMPMGRNSSRSSYVFVCWEWNYVLYAKEIETALPRRGLPKGFQESVQKIQKDAVLGTWCVSLTDEWGILREELGDSVRIYAPKRFLVWHEAVSQLPGSRRYGKRLMIPCRKFILADLMDNSSKIFSNCKSILRQHTICLGGRCHAHEMMLLHVFRRQRDSIHANDSSHDAAHFVIIVSGSLVFGCSISHRLRAGKFAAIIHPERSICIVTFVCVVTVTEESGYHLKTTSHLDPRE